MCAERSPSAHRRHLEEGVGCAAGVFCTRETVGGGRCVRKRSLVHTGGTWRRELWAQWVVFAHGRRLEVADVCGKESQRTQEASGGVCWVHSGWYLHTGGG